MAKGQRRRRTYSDEFKAQTVELIRTSGRSLPDVCRDLDLTETTVRKWVRQARIDEGEVAGVTSDEHEELVRLRAENRTLRMERDLMKKAAAFFAKDSDPTR